MKEKLLLLCVISVMMSCSKSNTVTFVFPDGFTGPFVIKENPQGVKCPDNKDVILNISGSRIVLVKDRKFLQKYHVKKAIYDSGKNIPVIWKEKLLEDNDYKKQGLYYITSQIDYSVYMIGAYHDKKAVDNAVLRGKDPLDFW